MNKYFIGIFGGLLAVVVIAIYVGYNLKAERSYGMVASDFAKLSSDVVGTRTVTSTVGVGFSLTSGGQSATSSYISKIGGNINNAVYTIYATAASSTSNARFDIQGSNDNYCDTTATSGGNLPLVSEISWFSAGDHLKGKVHSTGFSNASSTASFAWTNPMENSGQELILTDLNYECLKLNVSGSSTVIYAGIRTK